MIAGSGRRIFGGYITSEDRQRFLNDPVSAGIDFSNVTSLTIDFEKISVSDDSVIVPINDIILSAPS